MCCLTTIFLVFGSRITILVWWLRDPERFSLASRTLGLSGLLSIPVWIWTLLGGIFLPWTTLAYVYVFPGGIAGIEWIAIGIALLVDLAGHGGGYYHRNRIPRYRRS